MSDTTSVVDREDTTSVVDREELTTALVRRAQEGEQSAWDELVDRFGSLVYWTARQRGLTEADAADVTQTTWLRCVQFIHTIRDPNAIGAWLVTTARREAIRLSKRAGRQVLVGQENEYQFDAIDLSDHVSPDATLIAMDEATQVRQAMERLPPHHQDLMLMLMKEDRPNYEAIAEALGMPVGSIGPTRARQLERLRSTPELQALALHR